MFRIRRTLKPEVRVEIDYFKAWFEKSHNMKTKRKIFIHCMKLAKNMDNYQIRVF